MTVVVDASVVVDVLLGTLEPSVLRDLTDPAPIAPAHLDAEVFSALARSQREGRLDAFGLGLRLRRLGELPVVRVPVAGHHLVEASLLLDNVAARDALYVVLARLVGGRVLTTDRRLLRAVPDDAFLALTSDHDDA